MKDNIRDYIKNSLLSCLKSVASYFEPNELAYYSAQCKNELQIRDKIAWELHQDITKKYGNEYVVRREWAPPIEKNKRRVDLAILEMEQDDDGVKIGVKRVIAMIEFKSHSIARPEPSYYGAEFQNDVKKMREFKNNEDVGICKDADLYFVFLENGQNRKAVDYDIVLGFSQYQTSKCQYCDNSQDKKYLAAIGSHWQEFKIRESGIKLHAPQAICVGEAYGYKHYVSPLLIEIQS